MFDWALNTPFICSANQLTGFYLILIFREKFFPNRLLKSAISHINDWDQVNSWKNLRKFWNGPLYRYKPGPFPQLSVAAYWQSSNTEACAKKLSQILANNIENRGRGLVSEFIWGIVWKNKWKIKKGFGKTSHLF